MGIGRFLAGGRSGGSASACEEVGEPWSEALIRVSDYALAPFGALLLNILTPRRIYDVRDPSLRFRKRNLVLDDKP